MKIKHVYGNVLKLDIPLTIKIRTMEGDVPTEREEPFYPDVSKGCVVVLNNNYNRRMEYNASLSGNVAHIEDDGIIGIGTYKVTVKCYDEEGNPYRYMVRDIIEICDATIDAGIEAGVEFNAETYTLEGAVFISYGGEQVQSDWAETDTEKKSFIKNKPNLSVYATKEELENVESEIPELPENLVTDANYVHTDNNYTDEEKEKLAELENYDDSGIRQELGGKVDKVNGKGLSTNDFTNEDKSKLNSALQSETDPTVPQWAKQPSKPSYTAQEVGALPNNTKYGSTIDLTMNSTTYVLTLSLKDQDGTVLNTKTVDLPIESVVVNGSYDVTNKKIVLALQSGSTIDVPVGDLIAGLQTEITSVNMLDADLVDDTNSTHKFVTTQEKQAWNNKSDFSGSYNDLSDKPTNVSEFTNDAGYLTQHQDISGKADKSEMSVVDGTGADADKTTITLKNGISATVIKQHQDISGKQDSLVSGQSIKTINNESILGSGNITIQGGGSAYVPTLNAAPTSSTTSYTKDGQTVDFEIGQFARIAKQGGEYDFYQLYDLAEEGEPAETVATWVKAEYGGGDSRELLQLNLTTDQTGLEEDPLIGATVKVVVLDGQDTEMYSGTWAGEQISVRVNTFYRYKVVVGTVSGYITPHPKPLTPIVNNVRSLTVQYVKGTIDTIYIDDTISDPAAKVTGDVNGAMLQQIRSHFHRYLAKYVDGTLKMCQLNDSNSLLFFDNTEAKTDGTMGDVFVTCDIPFYTHYETDANGRHAISFSIVEQTGWKEWHFGFGNDRDAIGAYEMVVVNEVAHSISGSQSTANITQPQAVQYATRFGGRCVEQRDQNIIGTLFYALYGHTNCQVVCGFGTNTNDKATGLTNSLGMTDTVGSGGNGDNGSINFLGLENWWGNKAEWMGNIAFNVSSVDYKYAITEPDGTVRTVQGHNTANQHVYKRGMWFGENLDLIGVPSSTSGTDSTGYCDSNYHVNQTARVVCRSVTNANASGGVAYSLASFAASFASADVGSRLAFRGKTELVEDVAAFLAL